MKFSELDKYGEDEMDTPTVVGAEEDDAHLTQVTVITSRPLVGTFHLPTAFTSLHIIDSFESGGAALLF